MKRAILISIIFCTSIFAHAQGCLFDRNLDSIRFNGANKVIALSGNSWVLGGWDLDCTQFFVEKINCNGTAAWPSVLGGQCTDLAVNNGLIYSVGFFIGEDDLPESWGGGVNIYDTT